MSALLLASALAAAAAPASRDEASPRSLTSEDLRESGRFGVGVGLGTFIFPISGAGLQGFYALAPNTQLGLELWDGTWDAGNLVTPDPTVTLQEFKVDGSLQQLRLKYFVGNSFYLAGAVGSRKISFDLSAANIIGSRVSTKLDSQATVFSIAIGNTWTFESGFMIGGEWLGISYPISSSFSTATTAQGAAAADINELQADVEKAAKDLSNARTASLVTLHLGWQF